jgi:hypothetical protein
MLYGIISNWPKISILYRLFSKVGQPEVFVVASTTPSV